MLVAFLVLGVLSGIGAGLILGSINTENANDILIKIVAILAPVIVALTFAFSQVFKKIDLL